MIEGSTSTLMVWRKVPVNPQRSLFIQTQIGLAGLWEPSKMWELFGGYRETAKYRNYFGIIGFPLQDHTKLWSEGFTKDGRMQ